MSENVTKLIEMEYNGLRQRIKELEEKLAESQEILRAIQSGEVDAIIVAKDGKDSIYTLKGADEPYRVLFEQMNEGAITISGDCTILYSNQSFAKITKSSLERVIGTNLGDYIYSPDAETFLEMLIRSAMGPVKLEAMIRARDGTLVPMQLSTTLLPETRTPTYCIIAADLSERILAEKLLQEANEQLEDKVEERTKELKESEERLRLAQEVASIGTFEWNIQTGVNVWTPELEAMYGLPPGGFAGTQKAWEELINPEDREEVVRKVNEAIESGSFQAEFRVQKPDGSIRWLFGKGWVFKDEQGKPLKLLGVNIDITERKQAEEELKRSNEELRQFAYVASHDLQEPLRMVTSYLGLLEKRYQGKVLDDKAMEYMHFAVEGGMRMRKLIEDLLEYSRVDTRGKDFAPTNMNDVMNKTMMALKASIDESHATIEVDKLPTIIADEGQMVQLMQNLLGNSIKFRNDDPPRIHVSCSDGWNHWTFSVKDNGIGLKTEYADRIFQMFQRLHTRDEYEGTGVGLAIAKKIVDRHRGRIWVESEGEGKGSIFYFTTPKTIKPI